MVVPFFFFSSRRRHTRCALVTGVQTCALPISTAALRHFWGDESFAADIARRGELLATRLDAMAAEHGFETRGRGMMRGINVGSGELADAVTTACFDAGLIIETSGAHGEVVKILAPLIIDDALLASGLDILETRLREAVADDFAVRSAEHKSELQS